MKRVLFFVLEQKIRKKWKYLRDQFSVELGKLPRLRSGDSAESTRVCKWPYFQQLIFLKDIVRPRPSTGNLSAVETSETCIEESQFSVENNNEQTCDEVVAETSGDEMHSSEIPESENSIQQEGVEKPCRPPKQAVANSTFNITPVTARKKRRLHDSFNASVLEIENKKLEYLESKRLKPNKEPEDEHLLFFKSLLPHVSKIPESRILFFRTAIQNVVQEYCYQNTDLLLSRPSTATSSYSSSTYQDQNSAPPEDSLEGFQNCFQL